MKPVIFCGPTLSETEVTAVLDAVVVPPARQGDVYTASRWEPAGIGIVDGLFHSVPSVWHKEILWALSRGIPVYGASSMGALRAAELDRFGMVGVGQVYDWYRSGILEDDDEVALLHGPADSYYESMTIPMVNVRATVSAMAETNAVGEDEARQLVSSIKVVNYLERTWAQIAATVEQQFTAGRARELTLAMRRRYVDLKCVDAKEMVGVMSRDLRDGHSAVRVQFAFRHTDQWDRLVARTQIGPAAAVVNEVRAVNDGYVQGVIEEHQLDLMQSPQALRRWVSIDSWH